ncbi:MAG: DUF1320 domain-containing protein [Thiomicrospira sp.]|jgi:phage gp36-like protein
MPYSVYQNQLDYAGESELIQLTDRPTRTDPENAGTIDYTVLDAAMARADARIDRYITAYLPLVNVPADFVQIHCDFTRYFLYKDQPTEHVQKQYDAGIAYLEKVAAGKISIAPDTSGAIDAKSSDDVAYESTDSVFGSTGLNGF